MKWTSIFNGKPVEIQARYSVSGSTSDNNYAYVNDLESLRKAIEIARTYSGTNSMKGAGRVQRTSIIMYPSSGGGITRRTHEWFVFEDGSIELITRYRTESPSRAIADYVRYRTEYDIKSQTARSLPTEGLTPERYSKAMHAVVEAIARNARMCGFAFLYSGRPEDRTSNIRVLSRQVNDDLMDAGFRTLSDSHLNGVLAEVRTINESVNCGEIQIKRDSNVKHVFEACGEGLTKVKNLQGKRLSSYGRNYATTILETVQEILERIALDEYGWEARVALDKLEGLLAVDSSEVLAQETLLMKISRALMRQPQSHPFWHPQADKNREKG